MRWQTATIARIVRLSPSVSSFFFKLPAFLPFVAGQHVAVRLTAADGYRAQRSYSIASAPEAGSPIELAIEKLENGEVSPFFHEIAETGDEIEVSEPIGGHFIWTAGDAGPALMIAGGSGVAPFISMARHRAASGAVAPMALLYSARTKADVLYHAELSALADRGDGFHLAVTLTRDAAPHASMMKGRIDAAMVARTLALLPAAPARVYVCGSNPFVEAATKAAIDAGVEAATISTERYGV